MNVLPCISRSADQLAHELGQEDARKTYIEERASQLRVVVTDDTKTCDQTYCVPTPGEDDEPQTISHFVFDFSFGLVALATLFVWWPILQGYQP